MSITVASFQFNPGVLSSLLTAVLLYTMISLGYWQLDRADYKDTLQQKIEQRKNLIPAGLDQLTDSKDERHYLPVKFIGEYDLEHSFLLDNKIYNGPQRLGNRQAEIRSEHAAEGVSGYADGHAYPQ